MKDTCKSWLQVITACLGLSATTWGQTPDAGLAGAQQPGGGAVSQAEYGSVRLGGRDHSASAAVPAPGVQQTHFIPGAPPMFNDALVPQDESIGFAATGPRDEILWRVGRSSMDIYGVNDGFTNIDAFIPLMFESDRALWWVNPRVNITDDTDGAGNFGFGYRTYNPEDDRVYGASLWYDFDAGHAGTYHSLGGSFESIGRYVSMRFNFDLPVGDMDEVVGISDAGTPRFEGTTVVVDRVVTTERAYQEYDFELSTPFPYLGGYGVDVGVGAYYLTAQDAKSTAGVSLRTQAQINNDLWVNGLLTNDDLFNTNFSINFGLTLPQGSPSKWFTRKAVASQLTDSVIRRYRIPTALSDSTSTTTAMNSTGTPVSIAVIDPNKLTAGDGSFADPFMSVLDYESQPDAIKSAFDVVFVRARTDETDTNLNTTIDLFDGQALIGDGTLLNGTSQFFMSANLGRVEIPGIMEGPAPLLTNSAAPGLDVITLANSNVVTNFTIDGTSTADGIDGAGIDGFELRNLNIDNAINAIDIESDTSMVTGLVGENFGFIGNNVITGAGFDSNQGIEIVHTDGTLDLLISENTVTGFLGEDANDNGTLDAMEDQDGDGVLDRGVGIRVIADGATAIVNADDFIIVDGVNPTGITTNTVSANGSGIELVAQNDGVFDAAITTNNSSSNLDDEGAGLILLGDDGGIFTLTAGFGNTFSANAGDGARFIARDGGTVLAAAPEDLNGNGILDPTEDTNGNGMLDPGEDLDDDGELDLAEDVNMNGVLDFGFFGNNLTNNLNDGIELFADNSTLDAAIGSVGAGNTITGNGSVTPIANTLLVDGNGVLLSTLNGGIIEGSINGNLISNNVESGIQIAPNMGIADLDSISGNIITNNGFDSNGNPYQGEGGDAIVYAPSNGGTFTVGEFTGNTISNNRGAIIRVGGDGGIIDLGVIEDTIFDLTTAGTAGVFFDADNATITGVLRNNMFIGSVGEDINRNRILDPGEDTNGNGVLDGNADVTFGIGGEIRGGTLDLVIEDNMFSTLADAGIGFILTESDDRLAPGTGTPAMGDSVEASLVISGNIFQGTQFGYNPNFDGAGISLQVQGNENNILFGQNDIDNDGVPDATTIPIPDGSDPTTTVHPAAILEAVIEGNLIGDLNDPTLGNAGPGIDIRVSGDGAITDLAAVASTIDRVDLTGMIIGEAPGTAFEMNIIANNQLDGIRVRREDSGIIDNFRIAGNVIQNNREDGIDIAGENNGIPFGVEEILDFEIFENQILANGFLSDLTQGAAGRGIQIRADAGVVELINISSNIISGNRMSGIEARTFTDPSDFISGTFDSAASVFGGDNGIIYGVWELNTITDNGFLDNEDTNRNGQLDPGEDANGNGVLDVTVEGHGIALGRVDFVDPDNPAAITEGFNNGGALVPDFTGDLMPDLPLLTVQDNFIGGNAEDGLHIFLDKDTTFSVAANENRTTRIDILRNDIVDNGDDGLNIHSTQGSSPMSIINFNDNLVSRNGLYSGLFTLGQAGGNTIAFIGDGVEIFNASAADLTFTAFRNRILGNEGRGVNILNSEFAHLTANFEDNNMSSNGREGFYLVNAQLFANVFASPGTVAGATQTGYSANTWLADYDSNHEMFTYGHTGAGNLGPAGNAVPGIIAPFMINYAQNVIGPGSVTDLRFVSNIVDNNGGVVTDADGEDPYSTLGGFVMRVGTAGIQDTSIPSIPIVGLTGGVRAEIEDNRFSGNFGRDVLMDGFVSTEPPNVTVVPDPIIRIDLQFRNNRGGSLDVSQDNFAVFYNNTAPATPANNTRPNPPFGNPAVLRNAWVNLGLGPGGLILPGFGPPALRIEGDGSAPDLFGNMIGNNEFNLIHSDFDPIFWLTVPVNSLIDPVP